MCPIPTISARKLLRGGISDIPLIPDNCYPESTGPTRFSRVSRLSPRNFPPSTRSSDDFPRHPDACTYYTRGSRLRNVVPERVTKARGKRPGRAGTGEGLHDDESGEQGEKEWAIGQRTRTNEPRRKPGVVGAVRNAPR